LNRCFEMVGIGYCDSAMRVDVVDPSAYAPHYDHGLCRALARAGADVRLVTSDFRYGPVPEPDGYELDRFFYRRGADSRRRRLRRATKLAQHPLDMARYQRAALDADVLHFQWFAAEPLDVALRPRGRPTVMTAHLVMPLRCSRVQAIARRRLYQSVDAIIVHTRQAQARLTDELGVDPAKVALIRHGVIDHPAVVDGTVPLPDSLAAVEGPVVLCFGILRPDHAVDVLLDAWKGVTGAELWVVGPPQMPMDELRRGAPANVRFVPRFITDPEIAAFFRRADVVAMPYREMESSGVLATALAFGKPIVGTPVGAFADLGAMGAAELVPLEDPDALRAALVRLIADEDARARLAAGAREAARGDWSWDTIAAQTLHLYGRVLRETAGR
jgi:glycosyltransferase involved in cell wall biosynthesis